MAHVTSVMARHDLVDTPAAQQELVLRTIRSLLDDGLMEIGDILGASDERIASWDLPPAEAVKRVHDLFVGHHDEPALWEYTIWLGLTSAGERLARELRSQAPN